MGIEAFHAWLVHQRPSGDHSVWVSFFTREKGLLSCFYKGGRAPKKNAFLHGLTPCWLAVNEHHGQYYVHALESRIPTMTLTKPALFLRLYLNELLHYTLAPCESVPLLFDAYETALSELGEGGAVEGALRRFEWALLKTSGQLVSFTHEAYSSQAISPLQVYAFKPSAGFVASSNGKFLGKDILAMASGTFTDIKLLPLAKHIMRHAIDALLDGRPLTSRNLYRSLV